MRTVRKSAKSSLETNDAIRATQFIDNPDIKQDKSAVPADKKERDWMRSIITQYTKENNLVPPLSLNELKYHADLVIARMDATGKYKDFVMVLIGNAVWEKTVGATPYHRRMLMLPHCFRNIGSCPASVDEFGLLCEQCGQCPTGELVTEAEKLGTLVLIAEGTTIVTKLLESGQIDAVIGASCMASLERSFPYTAAAAIPGIAIPLTEDGCNNTKTDFEWIRESLHIKFENGNKHRINLEELRTRVAAWFEREELSTVLHLNDSKTEQIAFDWMAAGGKRWRPFLVMAVHQAVTGQKHTTEPVKKLAVAVECFHKASLVHDDIEDNDTLRYGNKTLHKTHGIPIALNIGDLLLGEGYRLIAECDVDPVQIAHMLQTASEGHKSLCLGQGEELNWMRHPDSLSVEKVLNIFQGKTAPAFEVALNLGAIAGNANGDICQILKEFSKALGIAYQIRDDIEDFFTNEENSDAKAMRPSLLLALALENTKGATRRNFTMLHRNGFKIDQSHLDTIKTLRLQEKAWRMFEYYRDKSLDALRPLQNQELKTLLFRIVYKILGSTTGSSIPALSLTNTLNNEKKPEKTAAGHD